MLPVLLSLSRTESALLVSVVVVVAVTAVAVVVVVVVSVSVATACIPAYLRVVVPAAATPRRLVVIRESLV